MSTTTPKSPTGSRGDEIRQNNRSVAQPEVQKCALKTRPRRNAVSQREPVAESIPKPKPTVEPAVTVHDPKVVLVKRPYMDALHPPLKPHRLAAALKTSIPFDGTGTLSCNEKAKIRIYDAEEGGSLKDLPLEISGEKLSGGKTVYVEGVAPSDRPGDVKLTLALKDDAGKYKVVGPKTDTLTCVRLTLDICKWDSDERLPEDVKRSDGRVIHVQNQANERHRAKLPIKCEPNNYTGNLTLRPIKDNLRVFDAAKGGTETLKVPKAPAERFVEGKTVSEAKGDTGLILELDEVAEDREGDRVKITVLEGRLELFRGDRILPVVPFATTDVAASLDNPLPDDKHFDSNFARPADFDFPPKTNYGPHALADADPSIFRVRLKNLPAAFAADEVDAKLKVTTGADEDIVGTTGFKFTGLAPKGTGMDITLRKNVDVWESPYLRVATTVENLSKTPATSAIVHSPVPVYAAAAERNAEQGLQFGRKLKVTCTVGGQEIAGTFTMGGRPYATVPVQFTWVAADGPSAALVRKTLDRIADLNAYWAGHGLTFELKDDDKPLDHKVAPDRNLIVIGEHTGKEVVTDHSIEVRISLAITVGGTRYPVPPDTLSISANIAANSDPATAASAIQAAIEAWAPEGALQGLRLSADVFNFALPRVVLGVNADGTAKVLDPIGAQGPTDITLKRVSGPAVKKLEVTGIRVTAEGDSDTSVDIFCPPVNLPFHDPNVNPASAAQRRWVRAFGPPNGDYVSVLIEPRNDIRERSVASLCEADLSSLYDPDDNTKKGRLDPLLRELNSSTSPISILNFGRWSETCAQFIVFLPEGSFTPSNDLAHELGHTFADRNHTPREPAWFYCSELMHASGPQHPSAKANKMTRHKIKVDTVVDSGGWKSVYVDLPHGYGGAARERIETLAPTWLDQSGDPGFPWT